MKEYEQEVLNGYGYYSKNKWKVFWAIFGILIFLTVGGWIIKVVFFPVQIANTVMNEAGKVIAKTVDADNVLYNYEWFKQTYRDYLATSQKIDTIQGERQAFIDSAGDRKLWTYEDKNEYARLSSTISGLKNYQADLVAQYNARSKMANRSIFKGGNLPTEIQ